MSDRIQEAATFIVAKLGGYQQIFTTRNIVGDPMERVYVKDGIIIDYCGPYDYIEIFGISDAEEQELLEAIDALLKNHDNVKDYLEEQKNLVRERYQSLSKEELIERLVEIEA